MTKYPYMYAVGCVCVSLSLSLYLSLGEALCDRGPASTAFSGLDLEALLDLSWFTSELPADARLQPIGSTLSFN
jgi:hypothetical protein